MVSLEYFVDIILPAALWPYGRLRLQHKWVPEIFPGCKGSRCLRLTTFTPTCADCLEVWEPQLSATLETCLGLYRELLHLRTGMTTAARIRWSVAERSSTIGITEYSVREMLILINSLTYIHTENLKLNMLKEITVICFLVTFVQALESQLWYVIRGYCCTAYLPSLVHTVESVWRLFCRHGSGSINEYDFHKE